MLTDPAVLAALRELNEPGKPDLALEVIEIWRDASGPLVDALEAGATRQDVEAVRQAAHRLKGSSANVGATALCAALAALESIHEASVPDFEAVHPIRALFDRTLAELTG